MKIDESRLLRALDDSDVVRWHANLAECSELTADIHAKRLNRFCDEFNTLRKTSWKLNSKFAYNYLVDSVKHYRVIILGFRRISKWNDPNTHFF